MNSPQPVPQPVPTLITAPSASATSTSIAASTVLSYIVGLAAAKFKIPIDVIGAGLGLLISAGMALFHRIAGGVSSTPKTGSN